MARIGLFKTRQALEQVRLKAGDSVALSVLGPEGGPSGRLAQVLGFPAGNAVLDRIGETDPDLALIVASDGDDDWSLQRRLVAECDRRGLSYLVAVSSAGPPSREAAALYSSRSSAEPSRIVVFDHRARLERQGPFLTKVAEGLGEKSLAAAAALPALRPVVSRRVVAETARENGLIGVAVWIPGADMPLLTLNQVVMVAKLGAVHGRVIGLSNLPEVMSVVGAGFLMRGLARQAIGLVPGVGFALKGAVAYGGTLAIGRAAVEYFGGGTFGGRREG